MRLQDAKTCKVALMVLERYMHDGCAAAPEDAGQDHERRQMQAYQQAPSCLTAGHP